MQVSVNKLFDKGLGMKKRILNILHQSDDNYSKVCYMSILSLLDNNSHLDEVNIYYIGYKISEKKCFKA